MLKVTWSGWREPLLMSHCPTQTLVTAVGPGSTWRAGAGTHILGPAGPSFAGACSWGLAQGKSQNSSGRSDGAAGADRSSQRLGMPVTVGLATGRNPFWLRAAVVQRPEATLSPWGGGGSGVLHLCACLPSYSQLLSSQPRPLAPQV